MITRDELTMTAEKGRNIVQGDDQEFSAVDAPQIVGVSRWAILYSRVYEHIPTGAFYRLHWREGATEYQGERPFQYESTVKAFRVVKRVVEREEWVPASEEPAR